MDNTSPYCKRPMCVRRMQGFIILMSINRMWIDIRQPSRSAAWICRSPAAYRLSISGRMSFLSKMTGACSPESFTEKQVPRLRLGMTGIEPIPIRCRTDTAVIAVPGLVVIPENKKRPAEAGRFNPQRVRAGFPALLRQPSSCALRARVRRAAARARFRSCSTSLMADASQRKANANAHDVKIASLSVRIAFGLPQCLMASSSMRRIVIVSLARNTCKRRTRQQACSIKDAAQVSRPISSVEGADTG
jgi:hypothetical protein